MIGKRGLVFLGGAAIVAVGAVWAWSRQPFFPRLAPGIYIGEISGVAAAPKEGVTFYLEKPEQGESLLAIVFVEGFRPQPLSPAPLEKKLDSVPVLKVLSPYFSHDGFNPVSLSLNSKEYALTGASGESTASGKVHLGAERVGSWSLKRVSGESVQASATEIPKLPFALSRWLTAKGELRLAKKSLRDQQSEITEKQEKIAKLEKFLEQESLLQTRAKERRDTLAAELQKVVESRKETVKQVKDLVNELSLLGRITNRGRAITLARRVQKRENDWYNANWQAGEDTASLEPVFQAHPEIDPGRLEVEAKRAAETQGFIREIAAEKERIRTLEAKLQGRSTGELSSESTPIERENLPLERELPERPASPERPEGEEPKRESLWNSIF